MIANRMYDSPRADVRIGRYLELLANFDQESALQRGFYMYEVVRLTATGGYEYVMYCMFALYRLLDTARAPARAIFIC